MAEPKETPVQEEPKQPTLEDMQAIAASVQAAAERAETAAQAATSGRAAAQTEAESRGLELPPDLLDQISAATAAAVVKDLNAQFELGNNPVPAEPAGDEPAAPAPADAAPAPSSWAARFLGG